MVTLILCGYVWVHTHFITPKGYHKRPSKILCYLAHLTMSDWNIWSREDSDVIARLPRTQGMDYTLKPSYCKMFSLTSYYKSSSVCLSVCLFVPLLLRGPLTDLRQTWWVYVGGPRNCPWGVNGSKGQTSLFRSRRHQAETTPLQKAHGV